MQLEVGAMFTNAGGERYGLAFAWMEPGKPVRQATRGSYRDRDQAGFVAELTTRWMRDLFSTRGAVTGADFDDIYQRAHAALPFSMYR